MCSFSTAVACLHSLLWTNGGTQFSHAAWRRLCLCCCWLTNRTRNKTVLVPAGCVHLIWTHTLPVGGSLGGGGQQHAAQARCFRPHSWCACHDPVLVAGSSIVDAVSSVVKSVLLVQGRRARREQQDQRPRMPRAALPLRQAQTVIVHHPGKRCIYERRTHLSGSCACVTSSIVGRFGRNCRATPLAAFPPPLAALPTSAITSRPRTVKFFRREGVDLPAGAATAGRVTEDGVAVENAYVSSEPGGHAPTGRAKRAMWKIAAASNEAAIAKRHGGSIGTVAVLESAAEAEGALAPPLENLQRTLNALFEFVRRSLSEKHGRR